MSIILMNFKFADLVAARPMREGRHLSCWGGSCRELLVNINHPCMFCGWWLAMLFFKRKLLLVSFSRPWMEGRTWYLEGPSNKLWACQCTALCLSSRTKSILDWSWRCVYVFAIYLLVLVEWVYLGRMGPRKMGPVCILCVMVKMHASWRLK